MIFAGDVPKSRTSPALHWNHSNGIHQLGGLFVGQAADAGDLIDMGAKAEAELADEFHLFLSREPGKVRLTKQTAAQIRDS